MITLKKISPTEFRLHNKLFYVAYSPNNYFEAFRFEITFQFLLMWFYRTFGIYFYIQKLKLIDDHILFQLYFYRTFNAPKILYTNLLYNKASCASTLFDYPEKSHAVTQLKFYSKNLVDFFNKKKTLKKTYSRKITKKKFFWPRKKIKVQKLPTFVPFFLRHKKKQQNYKKIPGYSKKKTKNYHKYKGTPKNYFNSKNNDTMKEQIKNFNIIYSKFTPGIKNNVKVLNDKKNNGIVKTAINPIGQDHNHEISTEEITQNYPNTRDLQLKTHHQILKIFFKFENKPQKKPIKVISLHKI
jgi:hypothetical protein